MKSLTINIRKVEDENYLVLFDKVYDKTKFGVYFYIEESLKVKLRDDTHSMTGTDSAYWAKMILLNLPVVLEKFHRKGYLNLIKDSEEAVIVFNRTESRWAYIELDNVSENLRNNNIDIDEGEFNEIVSNLTPPPPELINNDENLNGFTIHIRQDATPNELKHVGIDFKG
jgi:hypothetical protein